MTTPAKQALDWLEKTKTYIQSDYAQNTEWDDEDDKVYETMTRALKVLNSAENAKEEDNIIKDDFWAGFYYAIKKLKEIADGK